MWAGPRPNVLDGFTTSPEGGGGVARSSPKSTPPLAPNSPGRRRPGAGTDHRRQRNRRLLRRRPTGAMYGAADDDQEAGDHERTAFRKAEKVYKLYKSAPSRRSSARGRSRVTFGRRTCRTSSTSPPCSMVTAVEKSFRRGSSGPTALASTFPCFASGTALVWRRGGTRDPVLFETADWGGGGNYGVLHLINLKACFEGFYFIPGALSVEEQCRWVMDSLTDFPQPPNRTNHTAIYGPIYDLFDAVRRNKVLVAIEDSEAKDIHPPRYRFVENSEGRSCKSFPALAILRKLRWSTLGLQFDWSKRNYDTSLPHNRIPDALSQLAKKMAKPAMSFKEEFQPEAAIVNYFGPSDMLGGHLDDMEADWSKPIVSLSLGCKAIFLLGGKFREDSPLAMFLRSGDIVLMAGEARKCFHGVPRIFTDEENADIFSLVSQLSDEGNLNFLEYIQTSRININIRQVF
ncbi:hypothetical protein Taro_026691 [Colocasia esculenta]|uniref:Fe2OG dioxygenase domain-containing protein n=1 Tax=Colocasia esculenta TaxID=4460 RepID=A0A843VHW1_COLES|nr:hypothetical protein [Colocasia esculenta]